MHSSLLSLSEDTFCVRLQWAARTWRKVSDEQLVELNLSDATTMPLWLIHKVGEGLRQRTLADHLGLEGQSLVRLLDQLEAARLVVRRDDPEDRRAKTLYLTDDGRKVAERIEQVVRGVRKRLLGGIPLEHLTIADRVLDMIIAAGNSPAK